ncbi:MAG: hypothetical protein JST10_09365 [Bacteroidetes bacterium]|nr:hypothetical protein [Bacteroidota bacterium]MBS1632768.1 hypothetical protein [Bacteroidota bacterium]
MKHFFRSVLITGTLIISFILIFVDCKSQNIDSAIERYADHFRQERIYMQYDKSTYVPGETIWFKAYLMQGFFPANDSKNLYVDWTDDHGKLLFRSISPVVEATTNGQYDIPATYSGKFIHVKAYTKWMLNFDSAFLYEKDIVIVSKKGNSQAKTNTVIPSLQFFPEGGDAVAGVSNKIAFKANDQWGRPVEIRGIVQNSKGKFIDSLKVIHDGMGYIFIFPEPGDSFIAKWIDENGNAHTTALPEISKTGISMQVAVSGTKRIFNINATPDVASGLQTVTLIGTMHHREVFKVTRDISSGNAKGIIPTQDLPTGILTITAFNKNWTPLSERITYINNRDYEFQPEMTVQHWGLNKRARNEIVITVPDSLTANLAVSITDAGIETDSSDNIISRLLLTGDIKGQVYNPYYYFSKNSDSVSRDLDLVMLTHGWRKFKWEEVLQTKFPPIIYPKDTSYLSLTGRVYGALPSDLRQGGTIVMIISQPKQGGKVVMLPIEPDGTFNDPDFIIMDTVHIYYQLPKKKFGDASVRFMENILPPLRHNIPATGIFNNGINDTSGSSHHWSLADEMNKIQQQYEGKLLENVTITSRTKSPLEIMDNKYTSGMFSSGDSYQFDIVHDPLASGSPNIFYFLQSKVAGLQINTTSSPPSLTWRGGTPGIYIDEVPTDADMVSGIPVSDVAYVKVFRPPFMGGYNGGNGAIAIYTRRGDDIKSEPGKGLSNSTVSAYSLIRQFYSPNYDSFKPENDRKDVRTTLYWNPQVITTPKNNQVTLTFYNNDVTKSFRVTIEGMTSDGRLAHIEQIME